MRPTSIFAALLLLGASASAVPGFHDRRSPYAAAVGHAGVTDVEADLAERRSPVDHARSNEI
ncbi:hypothetical protein MMC28_000139 [Mycoblastus sanguinarius]|nr:hypothetical protein [Mycoblastus sanguinarius]